MVRKRQLIIEFDPWIWRQRDRDAILLREGGEGILTVWVAGGELKPLMGAACGQYEGDEI